jgi:hypothetical protein
MVSFSFLGPCGKLLQQPLEFGMNPYYIILSVSFFTILCCILQPELQIASLSKPKKN